MQFPFPPFQAANSPIPVFQDHASRIWGPGTPKASSKLGAVCRLMSSLSPPRIVSLGLTGHPLGVRAFAAKPRPASPASHPNHHPLLAGENPAKSSSCEAQKEQIATLPRPNIPQRPPFPGRERGKPGSIAHGAVSTTRKRPGPSGDGSDNTRAVLPSPAARFRHLVPTAWGRISRHSRLRLWNMGYSSSRRHTLLPLLWKRR